MESPPRLVAIGNAPIDLVASVDDFFLQQHGLVKGACSTIDSETAKSFIDSLDFITIEPGGGAANVACFLSALGEKSAFTGKVADDPHGHKFIKSMENSAVIFTTEPMAHPMKTAQIFVLTTPDLERSFAAYYGATGSISPEDLDRDLIIGAEITYIDCFVLNFENGYRTLLEAAITAKSTGKMVALNTNDPNIVTAHKDQIHELLLATDIVICNEAESLLLTDTTNARDAVKALQKTSKFGALTIGQEGAYVFTPEDSTKIPAQSLSGPIENTSGAGDAFAAGFCLGILNELSLERAGMLAAKCAAKILVHKSPRPQSEMSALLKEL